MSDSICKFMPAKNYQGNIKTVNFVFETEFKKLKQPFLHPIYYLHLVTSGNAMLKMNETEYSVKKGCLFFIFPGCPCEISGSDDFQYIYISFMGACVTTLLENFEINYDQPVYPNFEHIVDFWQSSINRINQINANILTESVLLYTLSFINNKNENIGFKKNNTNLFDTIVDYVDNNYREVDMSLKKISYIFSYTEKYLSHLFKKNMNVTFNSYLNNLRIQYAHELIANNIQSISEIASLCGYNDSFYFSKVFKKRTGFSPSEYIKRNNLNKP